MANQILSPANCPQVHSLSLVLLYYASGMDLKNTKYYDQQGHEFPYFIVLVDLRKEDKTSICVTEIESFLLFSGYAHCC